MGDLFPIVVEVADDDSAQNDLSLAQPSCSCIVDGGCTGTESEEASATSQPTADGAEQPQDPPTLPGIFLNRTEYKTQLNQSSRDPTVVDKVIGSEWQFRFLVGGNTALIQQVTSFGTFAIQDDCGANHQVDYSETYVEAWTNGADHRVNGFEDKHRAGPVRLGMKGPAAYLEEKAGFKIRKVTEDGEKRLKLLFKNGEERYVSFWNFVMLTSFTMHHGAYNWTTENHDSFYNSDNDFQITGLVVNGQPVENPQPDGTFDRMLFPNDTRSEALDVFPPPQSTGSIFSLDEWMAGWWDGADHPTVTYNQIGYSN